MRLSNNEKVILIQLLHKEIELKETDDTKYYDKLEKLVKKIREAK